MRGTGLGKGSCRMYFVLIEMRLPFWNALDLGILEDESCWVFSEEDQLMALTYMGRYLGVCFTLMGDFHNRDCFRTSLNSPGFCYM
jgi:hypothetical protein